MSARRRRRRVSEEVEFVLCSWSRAPEGSPDKCGWRGRKDKYKIHLEEAHGGKEYKPPEVGV